MHVLYATSFYSNGRKYYGIFSFKLTDLLLYSRMLYKSKEQDFCPTTTIFSQNTINILYYL